MASRTERHPAHAAAEQLGLDYQPPASAQIDHQGGFRSALSRDHRLTGRIGDVAVSVMVTPARMRSTVFYGVVANPGTTLLRAGASPWWYRTLRWFGWTTDLTGDPEFDRRVWVRGRDRQQAPGRLTPEVRRLMLDLFTLLPNARIAGSVIDATDRRSWFHPPDQAEMVVAVELLVATAAALTSRDA